MLWTFPAFVHLMKLEMLLLQGEGLCKGVGNCSFEKKAILSTSFPLQPHNKIHPYCLAFTYRAQWVSLSLVCTTERVNLRLQRTGLCNRFTSLSHGTEHSGGNSTGIRASGADQGPVKHSICVPSQRISAVPQHRYTSLHTHTDDCLERF